MHKLLRWFDDRFPLISTWKTYLSDYYVPKNLNVFYCFGALALLVLLNQLLTGLMLTMFYTPTAQGAFHSIEYIMRDVNAGWLFRYLHSTGASAFFIVLYVHLFRGLLYGSYQKPRELVWLLGMVLFILLILEAFFGYLLPWGQLSYWGAQVVTSLCSAIPFVGDTLVLWLRGDYTVGNATLQRFFALHVMGVPFLVVFFVFLHVVALHKVGSNNPQGIDIQQHLDAEGQPLDGIAFYPHYVWQDCGAAIVFLMAFFSVVFFFPDMGGYFLEPANFLPADPLVTPDLITPIWYMAPFYAMLRAIPDKLPGVFVLFSALLVLLLLPWLDKSPVRAMRYKGRYSKVAFVACMCAFLTLGYLGTMDITPLALYGARICTAIYFAYFLLMPCYTRLEAHQRVPERITCI
ncbi:MAG TPA: cytochrome b [Legionella sp.]|nr:cytochrome b [Legionella sp.]